jgi:hypothetical protein
VKWASLFSHSSLAVTALFASTHAEAQTASPTSDRSESLKGKTDQELVEIITGRKLPPRETAGFKESMKPSPLDRLWEMPPADAALAFVSDYTKPRVDLEIDDPSAKPPQKGEIGLRWVGGGHYAPVRHGVTILKYDGYESQLLISELEISGEAAPDEIEQAVKKTDTYPMRRLVAQQTYEILWWLRHIRLSDKTNPAGWEEASTFKELPTRFWIEPGGTIITGVITNRDDGPCGACLAQGNKGSYADFAEMLLRRLIERSGIQHRYPMPTVGHYTDRDDDAKFLHTPPPDPGNVTERKRWIARHAQILRNPKRQYLHDTVMQILVPISDPHRYQDPEIDQGLLAVMHEGLAASARLKESEDAERRDQPEEIVIDESSPESAAKEKERKAKHETLRKQQRELRDIVFDGMEAMEKLGFHEAVVAFPELFALAKQNNIGRFAEDNRPLIAAASIAGGHPELRSQLAEYFTEKLSAADEGAARGTALLEAVWRADLRELTPALEKLAALPRPTPNPNDVRESSTEKASLILHAWRETNPLTKAKIDALLSSEIGGGNSIPEVLRAEFEALSAEDKFTFRQFVNWMRVAGASVQLRYLENTFAPHTPRPDIEYER